MFKRNFPLTRCVVYFSALFVVVFAVMVGMCLLMREKKKRIQEATSLHNLPWIDNLEVFTVTVSGPFTYSIQSMYPIDRMRAKTVLCYLFLG